MRSVIFSMTIGNSCKPKSREDMVLVSWDSNVLPGVRPSSGRFLPQALQAKPL